MTSHDKNLLSEFVTWAQIVARRCKSGISVEVERSPVYQKQSAWINLADEFFYSRIQVWDSGEYELDHRKFVDDSVPLIFEYGENVSSTQFEHFFGRITQKYLD
jgi:hypothetical protein